MKDDRQHLSHAEMMKMCNDNPSACSGLPLQSPDDQPLSPAQTQLLQEKLALDSRINRLEADIRTATHTPGFSHLALQRMHVQVQAMHLYSNVLNQRIQFDV